MRQPKLDEILHVFQRLKYFPVEQRQEIYPFGFPVAELQIHRIAFYIIYIRHSYQIYIFFHDFLY